MPLSGDAKPVPKLAAVKRAKRRTADQVAESLLWHREVVARGPCLRTKGDVGGVVAQAHHVIPQQVLRRHRAPLWDQRIGISVSARRHARHHSGHEPIAWTEIDPQRRYFIKRYAVEYGLEPWLERHIKGYVR